MHLAVANPSAQAGASGRNAVRGIGLNCIFTVSPGSANLRCVSTRQCSWFHSASVAPEAFLSLSNSTWAASQYR